MKYYGNATKLGAQIPFNFGLVHSDKNNMVAWIDTYIGTWLNNMPENNVANWVVSVLEL